METTTFDKDIKIFYITAASFPEGIMDAHKNLHALVPVTKNRKYFGISRPEHGVIRYKAAAEELYNGEAEKLYCDTMILKKGKYISLTISDYIKDLQSINSAFKELLSNPDIDPEGYCVEWYVTNKDVKCMIRLKE